MDRVTLAMLIKCAERELGLRQAVYPRKIAEGNGHYLYRAWNTPIVEHNG